MTVDDNGGGGVNKPLIFDDIIYGSPLNEVKNVVMCLYKKQCITADIVKKTSEGTEQGLKEVTSMLDLTNLKLCRDLPVMPSQSPSTPSSTIPSPVFTPGTRTGIMGENPILGYEELTEGNNL